MRRPNELQWKIIPTVLHERSGELNTKKVDVAGTAAVAITLPNMQFEASEQKKTRIGKNNGAIIYDSTPFTLSFSLLLVSTESLWSL